MKYNRVISIAVLFLLLGITLPAFAQKGEEEKGGGQQKAQPAQHEAQPQHAQKAAPQQRAEKAQPQQRAEKAAPQHAQKAQPQQRAEKAAPRHAQKAEPQRAEKAPAQRAEKAQPQRAQQAKQPARQQTQTVASNRGGGQYGRISNANYTAHFGHGHSFHMGRPQMNGGYNRFQYGGYSFGYNQEWPVGWGYNDDFFVEYIDGSYYLCDLRFPGIQLTLNIF
jgi:hypothetical protein